jgi:hypothetical protein
LQTCPLLLPPPLLLLLLLLLSFSVLKVCRLCSSSPINH